MKRIFLFGLLFVVNLFTACVNDHEEDYDEMLPNSNSVIIEGPNLTVQQAMNNLSFVWRNIGTDAYAHSVNSVDLLCVSDFSGGNDEVQISTTDIEEGDIPLAYVVNFTNEKGFAILGANVDMPPVLVLGDKGNFSMENYREFLQGVENPVISPNSIEFSEKNFTPDELQYRLVTSAIISSVVRSSLGDVVIGGGAIAGVDTVMMLKCWPLVRTKWNQNSPYNYYAPIDSNTGKKSYAGCVPVAAAQTLAALAYHNNLRPTNTVISFNYDVDWSGIVSEIIAGRTGYTTTSTNALMVASFIRAIGEYVQANYSSDGTGAPSANVVSLFSTLGLKNARLTNGFVKNDAFDMIVEKQLSMYLEAWGENASNKTIGHAFVLDGWLRLGYGILRTPVGGGQSEQVRTKFDLVHCNFGYSGDADGYYLPGAFDLSETEFDKFADMYDDAGYSISYNFHTNFKEITFNL